jgi:hypothetical protein
VAHFVCKKNRKTVIAKLVFLRITIDTVFVLLCFISVIFACYDSPGWDMRGLWTIDIDGDGGVE